MDAGLQTELINARVAVLGPGHTVRLERAQWPGRHGRSFEQLVCSCGQFEEQLGNWVVYLHPGAGERAAAELALTRHRRACAGERGIYACGCTPAEAKGQIGRFAREGEAPVRPSRSCPRHGGAYLPKSDPASYRPDMTASEVLDVLARGYETRAGANQEWVFLRELRVGTAADEVHFDAEAGQIVKAGWAQRLDAFAVNCWPSKGFRRIAFEVKVTRSDFLSEIKDPGKRQAGLAMSNEFYFVTPRGLVDPSEIPPECGLIEVTPEGGRRKTVAAPHRDVPELSMRSVVSMLRHAFNATL
jgi:hypothetical protein